MPQHNGFHAWISIDGQPAPEYSVEVSEDGTNVTCWVASELGKKFSVNWVNKTYYGITGTSGYLSLDGTYAGGRVLYVHDIGKPTEIRGVQADANIRPFVFSALEISDDDGLLGGPSLPDLGLIALKIVPVHIGASKSKAKSRSARPSELAQTLKVHERAKKAVTQQVGLGDAEPAPQSGARVSVTRSGPPVVTFSWRYRPLDILQANDIAPAAASTTLKRKAEDEGSRPTKEARPKTEKEVLKNQSNVSASQSSSSSSLNKKPRVKNEKEDVIDLTQHKSDSKVKTEKTRRTYAKGEVIDLT
ncbi:hypothetical protein HMN09_00736000 [Mycena chlorophos]|uniref:DUF7918 domain-containing protein n=1 Tax=Mycena chlorophos TaxID=658473 RepID=A0A8H6W7I1_MYCCL|nr:hypothetical protein HMN09_00736000 [Mycena chlorophos]